MREAAPQSSEPSSPSSVEFPAPQSLRTARVTFEPLPPPHLSSQQKYWNEYDDGSENGDHDEYYAIYIDPEGDSSFMGIGYLTASFEKAKRWFKVRGGSEQRPLLTSDSDTLGYGYASTALHTDSEEEGYSSAETFLPYEGYRTHYALPSVAEQHATRTRERALLLGTIGCFTASFVLLSIASILMSTGKRKLRVEVDVGVTVGVMVSLFSACSGLGMTLYRQDSLSVWYQLMVWSAFLASCLLNGMLLLLVLGSVP